MIFWIWRTTYAALVFGTGILISVLLNDMVLLGINIVAGLIYLIYPLFRRTPLVQEEEGGHEKEI